MSLKGMVIRCSSIIPEIREAVFRCLVCGYYSEAIPVDKGNADVRFFLNFIFPSRFLSLDKYNLYLLLVLSGRITEPKLCIKEECQAKNSMTLVHNRCR